MLAALRRRDSRDDKGFTLIELMIVILIIAILLAIAIPTFLGARTRAQDRAAQARLHTALLAEKTFYTDKQSYTDVVADMIAVEPSGSYAPGFGTVSGTVGIEDDTANNTTASISCLSTQSASGNVFVVVDEAIGAAPGTYYIKAAVAACTNAVAITGVKTGF